MRTALLAIFLVPAAIVAAGCTAAAADCDPAAGCTRVLFVGNSYTSVNDLPSMVATLGRAGGHRIGTVMDAPGGATLQEHAVSTATQSLFGQGRWSVVILQEQSQVPAAIDLRRSEMLPAARALTDETVAVGARPLLFQTWAHRDGWPERGLPGYRRMQSAIDEGYATISTELRVDVVPVGDAWAAALAAADPPALWQDDGSHPTLAGTYLAACVFYATIFGANPVGLPAVDGVSTQQAAALQQVAASIAVSRSRIALVA